jgi:hypothetical protein
VRSAASYSGSIEPVRLSDSQVVDTGRLRGDFGAQHRVAFRENVIVRSSGAATIRRNMRS